MAAYDLDEQAKLGDLKAWWSRYGTLIFMIVTILILAIAAFLGWKWWTEKQSHEASKLYFAADEAAIAKENDKLKDATALLLEKFPHTGYASRAALLLAKSAFDAGNLDQAKSQLEWVIANSSENELKSIARLRLAAVLLDQKQYDTALITLDGKHSDEFAPLFLDMKGDIFIAQSKPTDAKTAYEAAIAKFDSRSTQKPYTQLKLDALVVSTPTPTTNEAPKEVGK